MVLLVRKAICNSCGGPRSPLSGSLCNACYSNKDTRRARIAKPFDPNAVKHDYIMVPATNAETVKHFDNIERKKKEAEERAAAATMINAALGGTLWTPDTAPRIRIAPWLLPRRLPAEPRIRRPKIIRVPRDRYVSLVYPFIAKPRDEHAELLAVNSIVPQGIPGREDICQEIMLALWEKHITLDQLRTNRSDVRAFVRSFNKSNYESGGYAISLDQPMYDGRSWYDVLPDAVADPSPNPASTA